MLYRFFITLIVVFICSVPQISISKEAEHDGKYKDLPELLIFISFSIPDQSLQQIIQQIKKTDGVLVIRGMYKNSMKETLAKIYQLEKNGVRAIIDPILFSKYNVSKVPAFVVQKKNNECLVSGKCTPVFDKISGNISLEYALERFEAEGSLSTTSRGYLKSLRGNDD